MGLYKKYFLLHIQSLLEYKASFILTTIGQFLVSFNVFLGVYFMFRRFPQVQGYSFEETLICFSVILLSYSLAEMFFRAFDLFGMMIGNGEFDRILLRPQGIMLQVIGSKIEFTRIGRVLQSLVIFGYVIYLNQIDWTILRIVTVLTMLIGGVVIFASIFILFASFCFFTLEGLEFMNVLTDGAREYGKYPLAIYGQGILKFTTYVVPFALVQYYPFLFLIGRTNDWRVLFLPLIACLFFVPCYLFWLYGLKRYQSTGS